MKNYILSKEVTEKKLRRMALEVAERNSEEKQLLLIGIKDNGVVIANTIKNYLKDIFKGEIKVIELSLDKRKPGKITLSENIDFTDKSILLIDDVANSGKAMLYSLKPLLEAFPKKIETMALVERTHKIFPIKVDYIGFSISTTLDEHIYVEVVADKVTGAWME
ncbi:MAG TPA: phosphoribosyltransferase family protein [Ferruginibacter sp.]|jgi:pyrimidine operon attenuation protein/uracil phosphoribosyltransferase|nr:phosphoribosyltransferase family protein [Ferruginibacter sp.]